VYNFEVTADYSGFLRRPL